MRGIISPRPFVEAPAMPVPARSDCGCERLSDSTAMGRPGSGFSGEMYQRYDIWSEVCEPPTPAFVTDRHPTFPSVPPPPPSPYPSPLPPPAGCDSSVPARARDKFSSREINLVEAPRLSEYSACSTRTGSARHRAAAPGGSDSSRGLGLLVECVDGSSNDTAVGT